jgi:hypothetical protein
MKIVRLFVMRLSLIGLNATAALFLGQPVLQSLTATFAESPISHPAVLTSGPSDAAVNALS